MRRVLDVARRTLPVARVRRAALTIVAVTAAIVVGAAGTAHANLWQLTDTFDSDPGSRWSTETYGSGSAGIVTSGGNTFGYLVKNDAEGFSSIGRTVHLTPAQFHPAQCAAAISLRASVDGSTSTVNVEVINPTSWTYIALQQVRVTGSNFQNFNVGPWTPGPVDVYFRVSLLNAGSYRYLGVDDLVVQCAY